MLRPIVCSAHVSFRSPRVPSSRTAIPLSAGTRRSSTRAPDHPAAASFTRCSQSAINLSTMSRFWRRETSTTGAAELHLAADSPHRRSEPWQYRRRRCALRWGACWALHLQSDRGNRSADRPQRWPTPRLRNRSEKPCHHEPRSAAAGLMMPSSSNWARSEVQTRAGGSTSAGSRWAVATMAVRSATRFWQERHPATWLARRFRQRRPTLLFKDDFHFFTLHGRSLR